MTQPTMGSAATSIHRSWRLAAAFLSTALLTGTPASAQRHDAPAKPHADLLLALGLGGEVEVESADDDLEAGVGISGGLMYPLHRHFALGGRLGFLSWQSESGDNADLDANALLDLTVVPAGLLPVDDAVELYLALPLGPSFDFYGEDEILGGAVEVNPAVGFTVSMLFGARFWLGDSVGLIAELGLALHSFEHDVDVEPGNVVGLPLPGISGQIDVDLSQPHLHVGVFFDL